ncbi:LacI family DNA-binding transcriptional regulator [Devosia neptuniae]|uniref:LacI family DNA-binding transcriptional regulator n=1 Tax=Devosia neptuniae TaxID=191302 RepID=UPI0022B07059|nr:LacI family DNA-binding transcriptional regulator [Devosia neptuniae]MCZ4348145.1 LacI family DNA-binding transcriptional regulator [Devosia neptuniae]|tara:strand:+ start:2698 stop:3753 length:1056 start_codon:yes stop_codon:yes gene_type:complete
MSEWRGRQPTIIDIAKAAGVSKSTAARALSDSGKISADARERVLNVAKRLGYERNYLAHSLRSGRTGMIGLVIPDIANPFWAEVARGAQDEASKAGVSLLIFSSDWNPAREASHLRVLRQARVDGAIVNPVADNVDGLGRFGLPIVLIGSSAERFPELSSVGSDITQGVGLGLDHLEKLRHHQPALLVGPKGRLARVRFSRAVHDWCVGHGVDPATLAVQEGEYTVESGHEAMTRLIEGSRELPRCVYAANDLMALGAMLAVREMGLRCPDDISILGFDGIPGGAFSDPGLSTVAKPARGIGIEGVKLLKEGIEGRVEHRRVLLPCSLKLRGSLAEAQDIMPDRLLAVGRG